MKGIINFCHVEGDDDDEEEDEGKDLTVHTFGANVGTVISDYSISPIFAMDVFL